MTNQTNQMPAAWMYDWETPEGEFIQNMTTDDFGSFAGNPVGRISNIRPLYFTQSKSCSWPNCLSEKEQDLLAHKTMNEMGEPTAFICQGNLYWSNDVDPYCAASHIPLYVSPPKQPWKGLTDEDKQIAFDYSQEGGGFWEFADAIEAILKRKNDGKDST